MKKYIPVLEQLLTISMHVQCVSNNFFDMFSRLKKCLHPTYAVAAQTDTPWLVSAES